MEESFPVEATDSKQAKAEEDKHKAEEIRQKAMESYGQTKTRLSSDETQAEPKKKRRGGNDSRDSFEKNLNKSFSEVRKKSLSLKKGASTII